MKSRLSNWKEESDLFEIVTGKMTDEKALKKVSEKKGINNKVTINPKLAEAIDELGGEVVSVDEALAPSKSEINIMKKINLLQLRLQKEKKKTTQGAEQAAKQGGDVNVQQEEVGISSSAAMEKARKEAELKAKEEAAVKKAKKVKEDYETKKRGEVLSALDRDKRPLSKKEKEKIAAKVVKDKGDTSKSDDRYAYEEFEAVVEYFYAEGINEEGIDLIIEEIGLDEFVDFVDDSVELLTEERKARKMNVRTKAKLKKDVEAIKADKSDVVARSTPKDVLSRARTERAFKKRKLAKPAAKKETPAPTPAKKAATVIKKARKATVAKARKDFDGDGKVETPKSEHRGVRNKKITKAVAKAKPAQPKKPASKEGLRAKIKSAYEAGVKRHRKATQPVRVFHKGMKAGAKKAVKFAKDVKKVVSEAKVDKGKSDAEKAEARNKRNTPAGKNKKFDTSVFITRKPGESLGSARARKRAEAHKKKQDAARAAKSKERATGSLKKYDADGDGKVRVIDAGYKPQGQLVEKDLNAKERRALPDSDFVFPGKGEGPEGKQRGAYPINDKKHARAALAMAAAHASPEKEAKVKAAVKKKYPGIKMAEDKALEIVRANIIKKHGKGAIYDPKRDKPTEADKKKAAAERQKRQAEKNKAFADRAKKAGYKNPQDYANVVARYGSEDNYKKGRGLD
jgi:hypothetical protein